MYQCRCTAKNSWWWTERPPETCRVVIPINLKFSASVGFIHKKCVRKRVHTILKKCRVMSTVQSIRAKWNLQTTFNRDRCTKDEYVTSSFWSVKVREAVTKELLKSKTDIHISDKTFSTDYIMWPVLTLHGLCDTCNSVTVILIRLSFPGLWIIVVSVPLLATR